MKVAGLPLLRAPFARLGTGFSPLSTGRADTHRTHLPCGPGVVQCFGSLASPKRSGVWVVCWQIRQCPHQQVPPLRRSPDEHAPKAMIWNLRSLFGYKPLRRRATPSRGSSAIVHGHLISPATIMDPRTGTTPSRDVDTPRPRIFRRAPASQTQAVAEESTFEAHMRIMDESLRAVGKRIGRYVLDDED